MIDLSHISLILLSASALLITAGCSGPTTKPVAADSRIIAAPVVAAAQDPVAETPGVLWTPYSRTARAITGSILLSETSITINKVKIHLDFVKNLPISQIANSSLFNSQGGLLKLYKTSLSRSEENQAFCPNNSLGCDVKWVALSQGAEGLGMEVLKGLPEPDLSKDDGRDCAEFNYQN